MWSWTTSKTDIADIDKIGQVGIGLEALDAVRGVMARQKEAFRSLSEKTREFSFPLTPVRIFDILCWTA
jgi:hypothetical protein